MSNFCFTYLTHIVFCFVFGLTFGGEIGMTASVLVDVIGVNKLVLGYGIQLFFKGIGMVIGPPIIGNSLKLPHIDKICPIIPTFFLRCNS